MEHVGRLGGTPYVADAWEIELDPTAGVGFSALHALRRDALDALDAARLAPWAARARRGPREPPALAGASRRRGTPALVAAVAVARGRRGVPRARAPTACCSPWRTSASPVDAAARGVEPLLPRIAHDDELPRAARVAPSARPRVTTGNLGLLAALARRGVGRRRRLGAQRA